MEKEVVVEMSENKQENDVKELIKNDVKEVIKNRSLLEKEVVEMTEINQENDVEDVPKDFSLMEKEVLEMTENYQGSGVEDVPKDSSSMVMEVVEMTENNLGSSVEEVTKESSLMEKEVAEMTENNLGSGVEEVTKDSSLMEKEVEMSANNQGSGVEEVPEYSSLMEKEVVEITENNLGSSVEEVTKDSSLMDKEVVEMTENNLGSGVEEVTKGYTLIEKEVEMSANNQGSGVEEIPKDSSLMETKVVAETSSYNQESIVEKVMKDCCLMENELTVEMMKSDFEMTGADRKKGQKKREDATRLGENTSEHRRSSRGKPNINYIEESMSDEDCDEGCAGKKIVRNRKEIQGYGKKEALMKGGQTTSDGEAEKSSGDEGSGQLGTEVGALGIKVEGKQDVEMAHVGRKKGRKKRETTRLGKNSSDPRRSSRGKSNINYIEESMSDEDSDEGYAGKKIVRNRKEIKGNRQREALMKAGQTSSDGESEKSSDDEGSGELGTELGALGIKVEDKQDVEMAHVGRKKGRKKRETTRLGKNSSDPRRSSRGKPNINYIEESMSDEDSDEGYAGKKIVRNRKEIKGNGQREALMKGGQPSSDGEYERYSGDEGSGEFGTEVGALGIKEEEKGDVEMAGAGRKKGRKKRDATRLGENASDPRRSSRGKPNINYIEESKSDEDYDEGCAGKKIGRNRKEIKFNGKKEALMKGEQTSSDGESKNSSGDESTSKFGTELRALGSNEEEIWDVKRAGAGRKMGQKTRDATQLSENTLEPRRSSRGKPNINYIDESMSDEDPDEDSAGKKIELNRKEMKGNGRKEPPMNGGQISSNDVGQKINVNASSKGGSKKYTGDEGSGECGTESGSLGCKEEEKRDLESAGAHHKKGLKKRDATRLDENTLEPRRSSRAKPNINYIEEPMFD